MKNFLSFAALEPIGKNIAIYTSAGKMMGLLMAVLMTVVNNRVIAQLPSYVPASGLIAYFGFNGNANDLSGNGVTGTVSGPTYATDRFGNANAALNYTGSNERVTTHKIDRTTTNSFSYSAWVNPATSATIYAQGSANGIAGGSSSSCIIAPVNGWNWSTAGTDVGAGLNVATNGVYVTEHGPSITNIRLSWTGTLTGWHHIVIVYTSKLPTLYVDGAFVQTGLTSAYIVHPSIACDSYATGATYPYLTAGFGHGLVIGSVPTYNFAGNIDDIAIYNRALTPCEITQLYDTTVATISLSGTTTVCSGATTALISATTGGSWSSISPGIATVGSGTGIVTGVASGTAIISYTLPSGCASAEIVTVNPVPPITGVFTICSGNTTTLSTATTGGTWSSNNTSVATVDIAAGTVKGVSGGTAIITYSLALPCGTGFSTATVTVNQSPAAISGIPVACLGVTTTLGDGTTGGTWSSSNTGLATVGSLSGIVTGIISGTLSITYTLPTGCTATTPLTVNSLPPLISGTTALCGGAATTFSDGTTGGTWSSSNSSIATAGSISGVVTGGSVTSTGMATITYTAPGGCTNSTIVTVNVQPALISGVSSLCTGATTPLFETGGGTWASSNTSVATVPSGAGSTCSVTGVSAGTTTIIYSLATGCSANTIMSVNPLPSAITGMASLCMGTTTTLVDTTAGGIWSSDNTTMASVDPGSGEVTANASSPGTANISYTSLITGCAATEAVTVTIGPLPISGTFNVCTGAVTGLDDGIGGGTWSSDNTSVATVDPSGGAVYGVAPGAADITYSYNGCTAAVTVTDNPMPFLIIGASEICVGLTTVMTDLTTGGAWSSSNTAAATIGSTSGIVSVIVPGTSTITYTLPSGCATTKSVTLNTTPGAITGTTHVCTGATTALGGGGGSWSSSNTGVATVGSTGLVGGIIPGTSTITYSLGAGCSASAPVTVNPLPSSIGGTFTVCPGSATNLTDGGGGTWVSSNTPVATAGTTTGAITGAIPGTAIVTYTLPTGCATTQAITVNPLPATPIAVTGALSMCPGATATLASSPAGGGWSSATTSVATVGSAGIVTGVSPGTAAITYTLGTGCGRSTVVTINSLPATITGTLNVCAGSTTTVIETTTGGTWSPAISGIATVGATGIVSGITAGTANITYTINATGCARATTVTVNPLPGPITGPTAECVGATITETAGLPGGTWSSASTTVATTIAIGPLTANVTGAATGTTVILYTSAAGCKALTTITVSLSPTAIIGAATVCANDTTTLGDAAGGGTWSSSNTTVATVGSLTGTVSGAIAGTTTITYSLGTGCTVTKTIIVNPAPAGITGTMSICSGTTTTLNDATTGGTWSSSTTAIASVIPIAIGAGGVTGGITGVDTITYTHGGCATTALIAVNPAPLPITGPGPIAIGICAGTTTILADGVSGGSWSSSNTSIATVLPATAATGIVGGVAPGTATITYAIGSCTVTKTITVNPISGITGSTGICVGATTTLSDATTGGTWSSGTTSAAPIVTGALGTGTVTGAIPGTSTITYTTAAGCTATTTVTVNLAPSALSGIMHVCAGAATTLTDAAGGGTWTSGNTSVATVPLAAIGGAGTVTGAGPGTATITYSLGSGCTVNTVVTVNPGPMLPATTGAGGNNICAGAAITLTDGTTGGAWSSAPTTVATITGTGTVTGVSAGTAVIAYALATGCARSITVTVNPLPLPITGPTSICVVITDTLSSSTTGGAWSSGNTGVATINGGGIVYGVIPGSSTITYTLPTGCITTTTVTINAAPPAITGSTSICVGSATALTDPGGSGVWSSGNTMVATVPIAIGTTGNVSGIATGTSTISYTVGGCPATIVVTVNSLPGVPIAIGSGTNICAGATAAFTDLPGGGTWSSSSVGIATIDASAGTVIGVSPGTATIAYSLGVGCTVTTTLTVDPLAPPITGVPEVCLGYTTTLGDPGGSGVWSSNNTTIASVAPGTGVVHGLEGGVATISYSNGTGCPATRVVTVMAVPSITGVSDMCAFGPTMHVADADTGGAWTSTLATVSSVGLVTSYSAGGATLTYTLPSGCFTTAAFTIHPLPGPITGATHFCMGLTTTLSDTSTTGTWSSSNTVVATIIPMVTGTGLVTSVSAGTTTISYTLPTGCSETETITVDGPPSAGAIAGASSVCVDAAITLTDITASGAGIWSGSNTSATVLSGMVSGVTAGVDTIKYVVSNTCGTAATTMAVTVNPLPEAGVITAPVPTPVGICLGENIVLSDVATGGIWSASNTTATVLSGSVSGLSAGVDTIKYTVTNGCGIATALKPVTVNTLPNPGTISGIDSLCLGTHFTLLDTATGGTWSSSNGSITITGAGSINAAVAGVDTITYSLTNMCGTTTASLTVLVKTAPGAGTITAITPAGAGICPGAKDTLSGSPQGGVWSTFNGDVVVSSTTFGAIITGVAAGVDTVIYTVGNECGTAATGYPVTVLSLAQCDTKATSPGLSKGEELKAWPNPNDGAFTVIVSSSIDEAVHIVVTNIVGEKVRELTTTTNNATEIKLNEVAGVYFVTAFTGQGSYVAKVVVNP